MRSAHGENGTTLATRRYDDAVPRGARLLGVLPNNEYPVLLAQHRGAKENM